LKLVSIYIFYKIAHALTLRLHYLYSTIPTNEWVIGFKKGFPPPRRRKRKKKEDLKQAQLRRRPFSHSAKPSLTPMLDRFRMESQRLQATFVSFVLEAESDEKRGDVIALLLETAAHLVAMQSFHGLMVINSALLCHSVYRLKNSWLIAESLAPSVKRALLDYTGVGGTRLMKRMVRHLKPSLSTLSEYLIFLPSDTMLLGGGEDLTFSLDSGRSASEVRFSSDVSESDYNNRFGLSRNSSLKISFSEMEETQQKREQRRKGEIGYKSNWMGSKYLSKIKKSFSRSRSRGSSGDEKNNRIEEESSSNNYYDEEEEEEEDLSSMGIGERALYEQNQKQKKRLRFFIFRFLLNLTILYFFF